MLGDFSQADLKSRFADLKWDHPPDYRSWRKEIQKARVDDFAIDSGDYISGVTIIAVPFFDRRGSMTHSIVAIDITERAEAIGIATIAGKNANNQKRIERCFDRGRQLVFKVADSHYHRAELRPSRDGFLGRTSSLVSATGLMQLAH